MLHEYTQWCQFHEEWPIFVQISWMSQVFVVFRWENHTNLYCIASHCTFQIDWLPIRRKCSFQKSPRTPTATSEMLLQSQWDSVRAHSVKIVKTMSRNCFFYKSLNSCILNESKIQTICMWNVSSELQIARKKNAKKLKLIKAKEWFSARIYPNAPKKSTRS